MIMKNMMKGFSYVDARRHDLLLRESHKVLSAQDPWAKPGHSSERGCLLQAKSQDPEQRRRGHGKIRLVVQRFSMQASSRFKRLGEQE